MRKFRINSRLVQLEAFTTSIPQIFDKVGIVIQNGRNVIKRIDLATASLVVKSFKGMYLANRIAYSIGIPSKSQKSYQNAELLLSHGISTPMNVGWIDCYQYGLLKESYYISLLQPGKTLAEVIEFFERHDPPSKQWLYHELAAFTVNLHRAGLYHGDYSLTNILVNLDTGADRLFSLVDLNRIRSGHLPYRTRLRNFSRFKLSDEDIELIIREYAKLSGEPIETSIQQFFQDRSTIRLANRIRKTIKKSIRTIQKNLTIKRN